jgi:hypothetical protein
MTSHGDPHHHQHGRDPDRTRIDHGAIAVAIRLLGDPTQHVAQAAREQLCAFGEAARDPLIEVARVGDVPTRLRAREMLRVLDVRQYLHRFAALSLDEGRRGPEPLLAGAVLASHMVRTFAPEAGELRRFLRGEADVLRARFVGRSLPTCARLLSEHLTGALEFRGSDASVLDLDQVLLDRVLEHRVGVPVALSLVYLLVGRWAGLAVTGVGMPDHFLVRLHGIRPVLVDPFHGGRTVTKADCVRYLRSMGYGPVREHLRDLSDRELLAHYLRDLRRAAAYRGRRDVQRTLGDALLRLEAH